jgi:hypothetical protein
LIGPAAPKAPPDGSNSVLIYAGVTLHKRNGAF